MKYICCQAKGEMGVYKEIHTYCSSQPMTNNWPFSTTPKLSAPAPVASRRPPSVFPAATARCGLAGGRCHNRGSNTGPRLGQTWTRREHPYKLSSCTSSPLIWHSQLGRPGCTILPGNLQRLHHTRNLRRRRRTSRVLRCSTLPTPWPRMAWKTSTIENQKGIC
uniref:Uncharacterized protein n=1 Tax=Aegilops tauschii subsp. strangulata TaxID=200361 RepID=A0A452YCX4_AEGTS